MVLLAPARGHLCRVLVPLLACALALSTPALTQAAMWVRMSVDPAAPVAGQPARVAVKTVYLLGAACLDDPKSEEHPFVAFAPRRPYQTFDLVATSTIHAAPVRFEVNQSVAEPTSWAGPITFPTPGDWTLRMTRPHWNGGHELCAGAVLDVTVLPNRAQAAWWAGHGRAVGFVATVLVLGAGTALAARQISRRRSRLI